MASRTRIPTTDQALEYAVRSIERTDFSTGRQALQWVLRREPENVSAWLWLKKCVEQDEHMSSQVLAQVTSLNPMLVKS